MVALKYRVSFGIILLLIFWVPDVILWERYALEIGNPYVLCPQNKLNTSTSYLCKDGNKHFLCLGRTKSNHCRNLKMYRNTQRIKNLFKDSHNGIRNKLARLFRIANMNLVYWSPELEMMSIGFIRRCSVQADACRVVGVNAIPLGQNFVFNKGGHTSRNWPGLVTRSWYREIPSTVQTWKQFVAVYKKQGDKMQNISQILLPTVEFFGCASAWMFDGTLTACYYFPPLKGIKTIENVRIGEACSKCSDRIFCSKYFDHLCGKDLTNGSFQIVPGYRRTAILSFLFLLKWIIDK